MLQQHSINNSNNFIAGWYFSDNTICDQLIDIFEENPETHIQGTIGHGRVEKDVKSSTDMAIGGYMGMHPYPKYYSQLNQVLEEYKTLYPFSDKKQSSYGMWPRVNIQKYNPGQGFYEWHYEKSGVHNMHRHLVFMTYLNDLDDGGETEFYHQKTKIKPEKGLTLIWPAEWPWTHRGVTSKSQTKYIVTGWYSYYYV